MLYALSACTPFLARHIFLLVYKSAPMMPLPRTRSADDFITFLRQRVDAINCRYYVFLAADIARSDFFYCIRRYYFNQRGRRHAPLRDGFAIRWLALERNPAFDCPGAAMMRCNFWLTILHRWFLLEKHTADADGRESAAARPAGQISTRPFFFARPPRVMIDCYPFLLHFRTSASALR